MLKILKEFEARQPEVVFEWHDRETEAVGWVVINSLRGGAAGGGTRMRLGLDKYEVTSLAKTMEIKFTVAGPAIGGAKSGINFDPNDPRKRGVLERWYKAITPILQQYYGTGGDLNVDELHEVIPITKSLGIDHPQEGVFHGHFNPSESQKLECIQQLQTGVVKAIESAEYSPDVSRSYTVSDMITGFGVAESVKHYYNIYDSKISGKRAIIQGWGNVGAAAAYYLAQAGVKIVGIIDRVGGLITPEGLELPAIQKLFVNKTGNFLVSENIMKFEEVNEKIWDVEADIFIPAASSRLVTQAQVDKLIHNGLEVISAGANVPFADEEIFFGPIAESVDERISLIPDFISNCGMARTFAYLMQSGIEISDEAIFNDVSNTIKIALEKAHDSDAHLTNIYQASLKIALEQLM